MSVTPLDYLRGLAVLHGGAVTPRRRGHVVQLKLTDKDGKTIAVSAGLTEQGAARRALSMLGSQWNGEPIRHRTT